MTIFYFIVFGVLGLMFGSFINAYVWRVNEKKSIAMARSMCPECKVLIRWYHNIPVMSFIILRAKCFDCKKPISWQYPIVEVVTALLFMFVYYYHGLSLDVTAAFVRDLFLVFLLVIIFLYDLKYQLILDRTTLFVVPILFVVSLIFGWHTWQSMLLAGVIGAGFFLAQFVVSKGKWIGGGDIRLGLLMGIILGWPGILVALFLSYVGGAIISVGLLLTKKVTMKTAIPFGVYLTLATFVTMFYGERIFSWYVSLIKF